MKYDGLTIWIFIMVIINTIIDYVQYKMGIIVIDKELKHYIIMTNILALMLVLDEIGGSLDE